MTRLSQPMQWLNEGGNMEISIPTRDRKGFEVRKGANNVLGWKYPSLMKDTSIEWKKRKSRRLEMKVVQIE